MGENYRFDSKYVLNADRNLSGKRFYDLLGLSPEPVEDETIHGPIIRGDLSYKDLGDGRRVSVLNSEVAEKASFVLTNVNGPKAYIKSGEHDYSLSRQLDDSLKISITVRDILLKLEEILSTSKSLDAYVKKAHEEGVPFSIGAFLSCNLYEFQLLVQSLTKINLSVGIDVELLGLSGECLGCVKLAISRYLSHLPMNVIAKISFADFLEWVADLEFNEFMESDEFKDSSLERRYKVLLDVAEELAGLLKSGDQGFVSKLRSGEIEPDFLKKGLAAGTKIPDHIIKSFGFELEGDWCLNDESWTDLVVKVGRGQLCGLFQRIFFTRLLLKTVRQKVASVSPDGFILSLHRDGKKLFLISAIS